MNHDQAGAHRVFLFSGHMIDAPGRQPPRFPAEREPIAASAIAGKLRQLGAGSHDFAISSAACGGDLLFAEAAIALKMQLHLYLPFDEARFLRRSVDFADADWHARYLAAKAYATLHVATLERGPLGSGEDPFERVNQWMLAEAQRYGGGKVECIVLWNGEGGDGPGGTLDMMETVGAGGGHVHWLNTKTLWG